MRKVLITGASGFLGSNLISQAVKKTDWKIYAVVSGKRPISFPDGVTPVTANLLEDSGEESIVKIIEPEIIIHMAWGFDGGGYRSSQANMQWLEASLRLLRDFAECGGKYFFFAGSSSEYGHNVEGFCTEASLTNPEDLYGMCKNSFNRVASMFCELNNIKYSSGRIFTVYGAGDRHPFGLIPSAVAAFEKNEDFYCREPGKQWNFIYAEDVVSAIIEAIKSEYLGIFNIAGETETVYEVLRKIHQCTKSEGKIVCSESKQKLNGLIADTHILNDVIGFTPQISLDEGIKRTVAWWKEEMME